MENLREVSLHISYEKITFQWEQFIVFRYSHVFHMVALERFSSSRWSLEMNFIVDKFQLQIIYL